MFPPRCCEKPIPLSSVRSHLTPDLIQLFNEKTIEFGTLNRVYCSNPRCSRFLAAQQEKTMSYSSPRILTCPAPECKTKTCNSCKAHVDSSTGPSHACQKDADDQDVLALAKQVQWARCPGCEALVELNLGCFHMTCRCKTEFCYRCQEKWKSCRCPQWDAQMPLQRVGPPPRHIALEEPRRNQPTLPSPSRPRTPRTSFTAFGDGVHEVPVRDRQILRTPGE